MLADLHLHSRHSDGRLDPPAVMELVASAGVTVASLTDHDTVEGMAAAGTRARELGIRFISGIEMTTYGHGRVIHMLGYGFDATDRGLSEANDTARRVWAANQSRWIASLAQERSISDLDRDFPDRPVRLPVLIERLCLRGIDGGDPKAVHERFRAFFVGLPARDYQALPSPQEAAAIIRESGGIAFVAHPARLLDEGHLHDLLCGCDGVEAVYLQYGEEQRAALVDFARARGKFYSGGSDFHGYFEPSYRTAEFTLPESLAERLIGRE